MHRMSFTAPAERQANSVSGSVHASKNAHDHDRANQAHDGNGLGKTRPMTQIDWLGPLAAGSFLSKPTLTPLESSSSIRHGAHVLLRYDITYCVHMF